MRTLTILWVIVVTILLTPFTVFSWGSNITHPGITNRAVDFLVASDPAWSFLLNYSHFDLSEDIQLTHLDEGSVKEDYALWADWNTSMWGSQQDSSVPDLSWKSHGFNPLTGETWYDMPDFDNALLYSGSIMADIASEPNFYFQVGRFIHLIEDMASTSHAHADLHATGDDLEKYAENWFHTINFSISESRFPSTDGLYYQSGLPHGNLTADTYQNYIKNVAWRAYYMSSYYGGTLVKSEGDKQPDSELKRMFPYGDGGLRYDDGGWFYNDSWVIDDVGNNWIGWGVGMNPDWWDCPEDPGYFYLENIDGDPEGTDPSENGYGVAPKVFKKDRFRRVRPTDNLSLILETNTKIFGRLYAEEMLKLSGEWGAGFIEYIH